MPEVPAFATILTVLPFNCAATAGSSGKLFGSVDANQIAAAIAEQLGVTVERKKVVIEPIKEVGTHVASVVLHKEVIASVTVEVVAVGSETVAETAPVAEEVEA